MSATYKKDIKKIVKEKERLNNLYLNLGEDIGVFSSGKFYPAAKKAKEQINIAILALHQAELFLRAHDE